MTGFFFSTLRHYAHALLGLRCAFLPCGPDLSSTHPYLAVSILEYRGMCLVVGVGALLSRCALIAPGSAVLLAVCWLGLSIGRALSFRSRWLFWSRLFREQAKPHPRIEVQYIEAGIEEIQLRTLRGLETSELLREITIAIESVKG